MNAVWLVVGFGLAGASVALFTAWHRRGKHSDLGAVSHQWISEHRQQGHDHRP